MGRTMFLKGMGIGVAVSAALSLCLMPRRSKFSRRAAKLLRLAGRALDGLGGTLGF